MQSPRGIYVNLLKSHKNQSVEKLKEAYIGSCPKLNKIICQSQDRNNIAKQLVKSDRLRSVNDKIKQLHKKSSKSKLDGRSHSKYNLLSKQIEKIKSSRGSQSNQKIKNKEGRNCRIVIMNNGKTQKQHYLQVSTINQVRDFLHRTYSNVRSFTTVPRQLTLEYLFTQEGVCGKFLNGQSIYLKPQLSFESKSEQICLQHFQIIKQIGSGGFSKVFLCKSKIDNNFYAMKMIEKDMILKNQKQNIIMNQRNIMTKTKHPFIIDIKYAFQAYKYIIFIVQYCPGGQLFSLIKKYHRLPEDIVRFYIIEIFLGLSHLHKNQVIYRDIKPENILIGIDGHIKIADLGLAKPDMFQRQLAYSFCGSPEYMSPQMIMQIGHTYPVDYYCMGALMYELLTGLPPFYSQDPNQIYEAVLMEELSFPQDIHMTNQCRSLLKSLLCKDQKKRLGSLYGIKQILTHPWFDYLDHKISPPFDFKSIDKLNLDVEMIPQDKQSLQKVLRDQKSGKKQYNRIFKQFYYSHASLGRPRSSRNKSNETRNEHLHSKENIENKFRKLNKQNSVQVCGSKTLRIFNR